MQIEAILYRGVALGRSIGEGAAGCPGAGAGAAEVLRRLWRRRERHTVRAAAATCEGAACVPVIGTKVVFTTLAGVIRGLLPCMLGSRCGPPPSEGM